MNLAITAALASIVLASPAPKTKDVPAPIPTDTTSVDQLEASPQGNSNQPIVAVVVLLVLVFIFYLVKRKGGAATKRISTAFTNFGNMARNSFALKLTEEQKQRDMERNMTLFEIDAKDSLTLPKLKTDLPKYQKSYSGADNSEYTRPEDSYQSESRRESYHSGNSNEFFDQNDSSSSKSREISPVQSNGSSAALIGPKSPVSVKILSPGLKPKPIPGDTLYGRVFKNNLKKFF